MFRQKMYICIIRLESNIVKAFLPRILKNEIANFNIKKGNGHDAHLFCICSLQLKLYLHTKTAWEYCCFIHFLMGRLAMPVFR